MTEILPSMLLAVTAGLLLVLLLRRPARCAFGAQAAFTLWLLPLGFALAPLLPRSLAPAMWSLPTVLVLPATTQAQVPGVAHAAWSHVLIAVWIVGALLAMLRLAMHCARLVRGLRPVPRSWHDGLRSAAPALDPRRLRLHEAGPAVLWALPRALLLLPEDFLERFRADAARELVLRHESTHVRRGDAWWALAMELASALLWFHPLAWLARPRFRLDQELACDAASLRRNPGCSAGYARALLDSAAVPSAPALIPWLAEPQLKERIAMISRTLPGALRRRSGVVAIIVLLAAGMAWAAGARVARAAAPTSSAQPPAIDITYKNRNPPRYPPDAIRKGEQGRVLLYVTVDKDGDVADVRVDPDGTTAPPTLQTAAIAAASGWKFRPGSKDGHAVGGVVRIPVTFSLGGYSCPPGLEYKQGKGKAYSCVPVHPAASS